MESCSPGFAGSRWIWSKEIVSFSDDAISDEISRHGCRIYFTLKMLRKSYRREKITRQIIPFIRSFSLWSWKGNTATFAILKVCSSRWLEFQFRNCWWFSHAWYFMHKRDLNLDCSSHMLLLGIFQYDRNSFLILFQRKLLVSSFSFLSFFPRRMRSAEESISKNCWWLTSVELWIVGKQIYICCHASVP